MAAAEMKLAHHENTLGVGRAIKKRRHVKEEEYSQLPRAAPVTSRSGRQVKPKVYADELVGDGAFFTQIDAKEADIHSSAEDCDSPIAEDMRRQIMGDDDVKKSGGRRVKQGKSSGGGIFKAAAVAVLQEEGRLMSTGDIAKLALKRGLIKCSGKTPEATMASALYTDIKRKVGESTFIRPREGLFGLKAWEGMDDGHSSGAKNNTSCHGAKEGMEHGSGIHHAAPAVGSANGPGGIHHENPTRDGLIDLLSAAEKIHTRKRKVLITAGHAPARRGMPGMRRKASIVGDSMPQASAGEKGSVVVNTEPCKEEACVQSPKRDALLYSNERKEMYIDADMCETMLFQLRLIRYCLENPDESSRSTAEQAVAKMEGTIQALQLAKEEELNNNHYMS